ncbi:MAG: hypothetical protein KGZ80_04845 [Methylomonas sp.]|nr:hypothetical protein [Methylomonas sp.]
MTLYIINTPVLTEYGLRGFSVPLSLVDAQTMLASGCAYAIGHETSTKQHLSEAKVLDVTKPKTQDAELGLLKRQK